MNFFKLSLSLQMIIATFFGITCGLFFGELCEVFAPFGSAYIMVLKITAVPYLIVAIIRGVGQLSGTQSLNILKKGFLLIGSAWIINVCMVYLVYFLFPSTSGSRITSYNPQEPPGINFAELLIPDNIFYDLSNNVVPAIVIFCLLIGIALIHNMKKDAIIQSLGVALNLFTNITRWISKITPIGTFLIIANQFGSINLATVKQVSTYIILYILVVGLLTFWIFPKIVATFTDTSAGKWVRGLSPILLLAYTTNFVIVCLPFIIAMLQTRLEENMKSEVGKAQGEVQGIVSIIFNLPLGSLFISVFVLFLSIFYNAPLSLTSNIQLIVTNFLTSLGAVGLGSWINSLSFLLDALMLPQNSVQLYLTTLPFTSGFQSMLSVMEISALAFLVTLASHKYLKVRLPIILKNTALTIAPVFLLIIAVKTTHILPPIQSSAKSIYDLSIESSIPVTIYEHIPLSKEVKTYPSALDRILETKTLRVGYDRRPAPFSFNNSYGELVGFDIAFAYQLAYDLNCKLEFIPLEYHNLTELANNHSFDVAMSAVSMNESRIENALFTEAYLKSKIIFVVSIPTKKRLKNSITIFLDTSLRIAALKGSSYEELAQQLFPKHHLIAIEDYDAFANSNIADVLIWGETQAVAWILKHRDYRILFPKPAIGQDTFAFLTNKEDFRFQQYLNAWLTLKTSQGFYDHQFDLWIHGKTDKVELQEPRWSVIRNLLHWTD